MWQGNGERTGKSIDGFVDSCFSSFVPRRRSMDMCVREVRLLLAGIEPDYFFRGSSSFPACARKHKSRRGKEVAHVRRVPLTSPALRREH